MHGRNGLLPPAPHARRRPAGPVFIGFGFGKRAGRGALIQLGRTAPVCGRFVSGRCVRPRHIGRRETSMNGRWNQPVAGQRAGRSGLVAPSLQMRRAVCGTCPRQAASERRAFLKPANGPLHRASARAGNADRVTAARMLFKTPMITLRYRLRPQPRVPMLSKRWKSRCRCQAGSGPADRRR